MEWYILYTVVGHRRGEVLVKDLQGNHRGVAALTGLKQRLALLCVCVE